MRGMSGDNWRKGENDRRCHGYSTTRHWSSSNLSLAKGPYFTHHAGGLALQQYSRIYMYM